MESKLADAIGLETKPVVVVWADSASEGATRFKLGRCGCVVSMFAAAAKGRVGASDRQTYGCWGGGVGSASATATRASLVGSKASADSSQTGTTRAKTAGASDSRWSAGATEGLRMISCMVSDTWRMRKPHGGFSPPCQCVTFPASYVIVKPLGLVDHDRCGAGSLGGGKEKGKRHPTVGRTVTIGTAAKILGNPRAENNQYCTTLLIVL